MFVHIDGFSYWATRELSPRERKNFLAADDSFYLPSLVMGLGVVVSFIGSMIYIFGFFFTEVSLVPLLIAISGMIVMALGSLGHSLDQLRLRAAMNNGTLLDTRSMPLQRLMIVRERFASRFDMDEIMNVNEDLVNEFLEDPEVSSAIEDFEDASEYAKKRQFLAIIDSFAHECCIEMTASDQSVHDQPHHTRNK